LREIEKNARDLHLNVSLEDWLDAGTLDPTDGEDNVVLDAGDQVLLFRPGRTKISG